MIKIKFGPRLSIKNLSAYQKAVIELVLTGAIWGFAFICIRWCLEDFSTSSLSFWRFVIAFIVGEAVQFTFSRHTFKNSTSDIKFAFFAGLSLGISLLFQTHGMNYTTATKSSFITSLYVVLIPIVGGLFFKHKVTLQHLALGIFAFFGMSLLLDIYQQSDLQINNFNYGDFLTLGCALASSFHILLIGFSANKVKSAFRFNNYQAFWALFPIVPFLLYEMHSKNIPLWPETVHFKSIFGLIVLSLFSNVLAFYLQIRAQKVLSTTTSSLLCLLEAPYAFLFATLILNEKLNLIQFGGVAIILSCSILSVYIDRPKNRDRQNGSTN